MSLTFRPSPSLSNECLLGASAFCGADGVLVVQAGASIRAQFLNPTPGARGEMDGGRRDSWSRLSRAATCGIRPVGSSGRLKSEHAWHMHNSGYRKTSVFAGTWKFEKSATKAAFSPLLLARFGSHDRHDNARSFFQLSDGEEGRMPAFVPTSTRHRGRFPPKYEQVLAHGLLACQVHMSLMIAVHSARLRRITAGALGIEHLHLQAIPNTGKGLQPALSACSVPMIARVGTARSYGCNPGARPESNLPLSRHQPPSAEVAAEARKQGRLVRGLAFGPRLAPPLPVHLPPESGETHEVLWLRGCTASTQSAETTPPSQCAMPHHFTAVDSRWTHETAGVNSRSTIREAHAPSRPSSGNADLIKQLRKGPLILVSSTLPDSRLPVETRERLPSSTSP